MTSRPLGSVFDELPQWLRRTAFGVLGVLVLGAVGFVFWTNGPSAPSESPDDRTATDGPAGALAPEWPTDGASTAELTIDRARGPVWQLADDRSVALTPIAEAADLSWSVRRDGPVTLVTGTGTWSGADLEARWRFERGNPQAAFSVRLSDIPVPALRQNDWSATITLPPGEVRAADGSLGVVDGDDLTPPHALSPWDPTWVQWRGSDRRLGLVDWTGDGLTLRPSGDATDLEFHLWRAASHPLLKHCQTDGESPATLDLRASARVWVGAAPAVFPSRVPSGNAAAVAPIFDLPDAHPDSTLHRGHADAPDGWAARARTMAFGHSNAEDPRYGNGGLLGHGLGGTIAVPAKWWDSDPVSAFRDEVERTDLSVAPRGELPDAAGNVDVAIGESFSCSALLDGGDDGIDAVAHDFVPYRDTLASAVGPQPGDADPAISAPITGLAAGARPLQLDGTRPELTDSALADSALDALIQKRGVATFATPLVGSRNPLIPAAREALLEPERHGEWTVSSPFAETLAHLEISAEAKPVTTRSLGSLVDYWQRTRDTARRWTGDGRLLVRSDAAVSGYTLVVDGIEIPDDAIDVKKAADVQIRRANDRAGAGKPSPQTWISWDLEAETTYRVSFGDATPKVVDPAPITWKVKE